jgi:tRNA threonylcarbamoyladenosine biosynthesis protein TsaB
MASPLLLTGRLVCPVIDARRGEVFWQLFRPEGRPEGDVVHPVGPPRCTPPADLAAELRGLREPLVLVGDGVDRYASELVDLGDVLLGGAALAFPSAATLVSIGLRELRHGHGVRSDELAPLYLRAPDAAINWSTRDGAVTA